MVNLYTTGSCLNINELKTYKYLGLICYSLRDHKEIKKHINGCRLCRYIYKCNYPGNPASIFTSALQLSAQRSKLAVHHFTQNQQIGNKALGALILLSCTASAFGFNELKKYYYAQLEYAMPHKISLKLEEKKAIASTTALEQKIAKPEATLIKKENTSKKIKVKKLKKTKVQVRTQSHVEAKPETKEIKSLNTQALVNVPEPKINSSRPNSHFVSKLMAQR